MDNPYLDEIRSISKRSGWGSWMLEERRRLISKYSFAIPSEESILAIKGFSDTVIEVGAGSGYWAWLMSQVGIKVFAFDTEKPPNDLFTTSWHPIIIGNPVYLKKPVTAALFLCWPPYDSPMAFDALQRYPGNKLIYVGEGMEGCTADDRFHRELAAKWALVKSVSIPQWEYVHDYMMIYERNR